MSDLRKLSAADPQFPRVVFVHQGTEEVADALMPKLWAEAPAISDPERKLYVGFGLKRTTAWKLMRPRAWFHGIRAIFKGYGVGSPRGADVLQLPGMFLVHDGEVVWEHPFTGGIGDRPDWKDVKRRATTAVGA